MKRLMLLPLLLCLAAGPATRPADRWLDRAATAYQAALDDTKSPELLVIGDRDLGIALVRLRGSDADKALLRRAMAVPPERKRQMPENVWAVEQAVYNVDALIALGELDEAEATFEKARPLVDKLTQPLPIGEWSTADLYHGTHAVQLGDYETARKHLDLELLVPTSQWAGQIALRDKALAELTAAADSNESRARLVDVLARVRRLDGAAKTVENINDHRETQSLWKVVEAAIYFGQNDLARRGCRRRGGASRECRSGSLSRCDRR